MTYEAIRYSIPSNISNILKEGLQNIKNSLDIQTQQAAEQAKIQQAKAQRERATEDAERKSRLDIVSQAFHPVFEEIYKTLLSNQETMVAIGEVTTPKQPPSIALAWGKKPPKGSLDGLYYPYQISVSHIKDNVCEVIFGANTKVQIDTNKPEWEREFVGHLQEVFPEGCKKYFPTSRDSGSGSDYYDTGIS